MRGIAGTLHPARVLQLVAAIAPPLAVVAPLAFAILLPLGALLAAAAAWRVGGLRWPPRSALVLFAAFALWSAASAAWALDPALVWSVWGQIAGLGVAGLLLLGIARDVEDDARLRIGLALAIGLTAALGLLFVEWISSLVLDQSIAAMLYAPRPFRPYVFNRAAAALAILVWPAAYAVHLRFGRRAAVALVAATVAVVALFPSMAALLGFAGGGVAWFAASRRPRQATIVLAAAIVIAAAVAPLLPRLPALEAFPGLIDISVSTYHRLEIWRFVSERIAERPLAGWGLNASRELPGGQAFSEFGKRQLPLHPHNFLLQVWLELGFVGMALVVLLLLGAVRGGASLDPETGPAAHRARACAFATIASGSLVAAVGYGIWQAWWMAMLWTAAALVAAVAKGQARR